MADPFQKLRAGDVFDSVPHEAWNGFIDAANDYRQRVNGARSSTLYGRYPTGIVPVKNSSGSDRSRFDVLTVTGVINAQSSLPDDFYNQPTVTAGTPGTALEKFVVLQEPVKSGEIGRGMLIGVTAQLINMVDANDDWADVSSGAYSLVSSPFGSAKIITVASGTGNKWGYVAIGAHSPFAIGKTASSHAKGATGTINVYRGTTKGSESWTSSKTISAYNRFGDVASGKWVLCAWIQRGWEIITAEC